MLYVVMIAKYFTRAKEFIFLQNTLSSFELLHSSYSWKYSEARVLDTQRHLDISFLTVVSPKCSATQGYSQSC